MNVIANRNGFPSCAAAKNALYCCFREQKEVKRMHIVDCHCHIYPEKIAAKAVAGIGGFYDMPMACAGTLADAREWR